MLVRVLLLVLGAGKSSRKNNPELTDSRKALQALRGSLRRIFQNIAVLGHAARTVSRFRKATVITDVVRRAKTIPSTLPAILAHARSLSLRWSPRGLRRSLTAVPKTRPARARLDWESSTAIATRFRIPTDFNCLASWAPRKESTVPAVKSTTSSSASAARPDPARQSRARRWAWEIPGRCWTRPDCVARLARAGLATSRPTWASRRDGSRRPTSLARSIASTASAVSVCAWRRPSASTLLAPCRAPLWTECTTVRPITLIAAKHTISTRPLACRGYGSKQANRSRGRWEFPT